MQLLTLLRKFHLISVSESMKNFGKAVKQLENFQMLVASDKKFKVNTFDVILILTRAKVDDHSTKQPDFIPFCITLIH